MSPLTTATTCYSGAKRNKGGDDGQTLRLATEANLLGIRWGQKVWNTDAMETTSEIIKSSSSSSSRSKTVCVGFSQWNDESYALALVDSSQMIDSSSKDPNVNSAKGPRQSTTTLVEKDDNLSVTTPITSATNNNVPGSNITEPLPLAKTVSNSSTTINIDKSSAESTTGETKTSNAKKGTAWLLLKANQGEYKSFFDYRPLCPCVAQWGNESVGVWVGSADDALLRLYMIPKDGIDDDKSYLDSKQLKRKLLNSDYFHTETPVTAIDFVLFYDDEEEEISILALACQDGTIQLISWKGDDFVSLHKYQVIVDGPLLSLQLHKSSQDQKVHLVAGSLCGYVCQLVSKDAKSWEGPTMVVSNLWNDVINAEDSVLTVHAWENLICVGTHGGRCILYTCTANNECKMVWECLLPYSVNSILSKYEASSKSLLLLITTRRSFHIFQQMSEN